MKKYRVGRKLGRVILDTSNSREVARATTEELAQEICRLLNNQVKNNDSLDGVTNSFSLLSKNEQFWISIKKAKDCLFSRRNGYKGKIIFGYSICIRLFGRNCW